MQNWTAIKRYAIPESFLSNFWGMSKILIKPLFSCFSVALFPNIQFPESCSDFWVVWFWIYKSRIKKRTCGELTFGYSLCFFHLAQCRILIVFSFFRYGGCLSLLELPRTAQGVVWGFCVQLVQVGERSEVYSPAVVPGVQISSRVWIWRKECPLHHRIALWVFLTLVLNSLAQALTGGVSAMCCLSIDCKAVCLIRAILFCNLLNFIELQRPLYLLCRAPGIHPG